MFRSFAVRRLPTAREAAACRKKKGALRLYLRQRWGGKHPSVTVDACSCSLSVPFLIALFDKPVFCCVDASGGRQGGGSVMATDFSSTSTWIKLCSDIRAHRHTDRSTHAACAECVQPRGQRSYALNRTYVAFSSDE